MVCTSLTLLVEPDAVARVRLAPLVRLVPLAVIFSTLIDPDVSRNRGEVSEFSEVLSYLTLMFPVPTVVS
ncbi:MAG: hypothetical protein ACKPHU_13075, partial [Planctomycetaceae bacterium]